MDELQHQDAPQAEKAPSRLEALLRRSALAIVAERVWRLGMALATLALFFLALSWLGFWRAAPLEARIGGVALFGFAALYVVAREIMRGWPRRRAAMARLDGSADAALRPASSLQDTLAPQNADPGTAALWTLHRKRLEAALAATPVAAPQPGVPQRDPYALRALALVAAVSAAFVAGDEKRARLAAAFDWRALPSFGLDGASRRLAGAARLYGPSADRARAGERSSRRGASQFDFAHSAGRRGRFGQRRTRPRRAEPGKEAAKEASKEQAFKLAGAAQLSLPDGRRFDLVALPDRPPTIRFDREAAQQRPRLDDARLSRRGRLRRRRRRSGVQRRRTAAARSMSRRASRSICRRAAAGRARPRRRSISPTAPSPARNCRCASSPRTPPTMKALPIR